MDDIVTSAEGDAPGGDGPGGGSRRGLSPLPAAPRPRDPMPVIRRTSYPGCRPSSTALPDGRGRWRACAATMALIDASRALSADHTGRAPPCQPCGGTCAGKLLVPSPARTRSVPASSRCPTGAFFSSSRRPFGRNTVHGLAPASNWSSTAARMPDALGVVIQPPSGTSRERGAEIPDSPIAATMCLSIRSTHCAQIVSIPMGGPGWIAKMCWSPAAWWDISRLWCRRSPIQARQWCLSPGNAVEVVSAIRQNPRF